MYACTVFPIIGVPNSRSELFIQNFRSRALVSLPSWKPEKRSITVSLNLKYSRPWFDKYEETNV